MMASSACSAIATGAIATGAIATGAVATAAGAGSAIATGSVAGCATAVRAVAGSATARGPITTARLRVVARGLQALTGALVVAYLASTIFRARHVSSTLYDGWIGNLGYGACALLCAVRAAVVRRQRLAWSAIALSLVLLTCGAVLWTTVVQFDRPVPYPSVSDLFFLVFYPVAYLGVGTLVVDGIGNGSRAV
jgi:hypothetical protein